MDYIPTPHQEEDSERMLDYQHALVWHDPGTGKTVTAMLAYQKGGYERMLVICPKNAMSMWTHELTTQLGMRVVQLKTGRPPSKKLGAYHADAIVVSMDLARKHQDYLRKWARNWKTNESRKAVCVIDEAHMLKSVTAKRTQAVFNEGVTGKFRAIVAHYEDVWELTGTPVTRYYDDLYAQLRPVRGDILKHYNVDTYEKWCSEFTVRQLKRYGNGPARRVVTGNRNHKKLERLLKACCVLRRKLADVVDDLPPITYRVMTAEVSGVADDGFEMDQVMRELHDPDSPSAKVRRLLGVAKAPAVVQYLTQLGELGIRNVLVGYWHKDVAAELQTYMSGKEYAIVDGSTSTAARDKIMERFNNGELDYLFGQMQAMNTSWNLQKKSYNVVIAEELPSPAMLDQFIARVYRRGQKNHVQVDILRAEHSLDIALAGIRENKGKDIERLI